MTSPRRPLLPALLISLGCVAGCASSEDGGGPVDAIESTAAHVVLPVSEENELGRRMAAEIEQQVTLVQDPAVTGYVEDLGQQIVAAAGDDVPEGIEFTFKVIEEDQQVNAFAIPGGTIYVYTGLLGMVESEAELMSVLSHEVAHVTERHIAEQLAAQYGLQTLTSLALGENAGVLSQLVGAVAQQGSLLTYTRSHEQEADEVGLRLEAQAGWDPHGYVTFFQRLAELRGEGGWVPSWLQTHPAPQDRVAQARELIAQLEQVPERTGRQEYLQFKQQQLRASGTK